MIWILVGLLACETQSEQVKEKFEEKVGEHIQKQTAEALKKSNEKKAAEQKKAEEETTSDKSEENPTKNSGEIHTQIGKKNVDIKYDHMEDIEGTENGKKIQGLDIKIGNMNIKVDEVEVENLKIEKKEVEKEEKK